MGSGGAITQSFHTFCPESLDPFGDGLGRHVELVGRVSLAQSTFHHASGHRLSTFGRQRRILVDVHLVPPWNTEASQPQLPRFRPDGQPPERPRRGRASIRVFLNPAARETLYDGVNRPGVSDHGPPPSQPTRPWPRPGHSRSRGSMATISTGSREDPSRRAATSWWPEPPRARSETLHRPPST